MPKPEIILNIEKQIGKVLLQKEFEEFYFQNQFQYPSIWNTFSIDGEQNVVALSLKFVNILDFGIFEELKNIKLLAIWGCSIKEIEFLKNLTTLNFLIFWENQILNISAIKDLKNLVIIDFSQNRISDISAIKSLKKLTKIVFSDNTITDISVLKDFKNLTEICFKKNSITDISVLKDLRSLTKINFSHNQISDISVLKDLRNLIEIDFSHNQISDISVLKDLRNLIEIDFFHNQITNISALKKLQNLSKLDFGINKITEISAIKDLKKLYHFKFYDNRIKNLPVEIFANFNNSWKQVLSKNPIEQPPIEIIEQGYAAIKDWFEKQKVENDEIKLILTGNTTAGKTSLIHFLLYETYPPENSTHGIAVYNHKFDTLNVNIWDFGGQEYYHATHKLFLSNNAVYLLLWEKLKNKTDFLDTEIRIEGKTSTIVQKQQHFHYNYWLHLIRREYAKDSPILMVQNKIDQTQNHEDSKIDTRYFDDNTKNYSISVKKAYNYSQNQTEELEEYNDLFKIFKRNLFKTLKETAKDRQIQKYFDNIRTAVREMAKEQNILEFEEYRNLCFKKAGEEITDENIRFATVYLHETGVLLYYGYNEQLPQSILKNYVFINPNYVCEQIYKILNLQVQQNFGKFNKQHAENILQNPTQANLFIALMQSPNFELIYKAKQEPDTYIATQYLQEEYPEGERSFARLTKNKQTALVLHFPDFFSPSIMSRFIARIGFDIIENIVWKNGVIFDRTEIEIFALCEPKANKIFIKTKTQNRQHQSVAEVFRIFAQLCDDKNIELSTDNQTFDTLENIERYKVDKYSFLFHHNTNKMTKTEIQKLIADNKTNQAIEYMKTLCSNMSIEIGTLEAKYNSLKKSNLIGTISNQEYGQGLAQVNYGLLSILNDCQPENKPLDKPGIKKNSTKIGNMDTPKIYFSYAWGDNNEQGKSREKIVNELYNELVKENYNVIRDKMDLGYRGFISDFMQKIGKGDLIVIATSEKYFKSPYCMYELYEIARNCKFDKHYFAEKSLPMMVEFIDFSKPKNLKIYRDYWKEELSDWEDLIKDDPNSLSQSQYDRYSKTKLIQQNFGTLVDWLIDMNTLNPKMLSENNFAEIKNTIANYKRDNK